MIFPISIANYRLDTQLGACYNRKENFCIYWQGNWGGNILKSRTQFYRTGKGEDNGKETDGNPDKKGAFQASE